jgi:acyl carrier protein
MQQDITEVVREAVAATLSADTDAVPTGAAVVADLGVESIELVDVLFRIECALGTRLALDDIGPLLQGDLDDDAFLDSRGLLTPAAQAQLAAMLTAPTATRITPGLRLDQVSGLLTVDDLAALLQPLLTGTSQPCLAR